MSPAELRKRCPGLDDLLGRRPELARSIEIICDHGLQGAILRYLAEGSPEQFARFCSDLSELNLKRVKEHRLALQTSGMPNLGPEDVAPVELVTLEEQSQREQADRAAGQQALRAGRFASLAFAGGAGTRFFSSLDDLQAALTRPNMALQQGGFDAQEPKGIFPISPVGGLSFYALVIGEALRIGVECGRLPWVLLLTSRVTHERSLFFLRTADLWGLPEGAWRAFMQADEPRLDMNGDLVVEPDGGLAWTGNGHGGVYQALLEVGQDGRSLRDVLAADGVEHLVMHNVDNAAARPFAPARLGFHLREGAQFTVSATRKLDPAEKVGLLMRMRGSGRVEVVEYNVLSPEIARQRSEQTGRLVHEAGNINTNLVALDALHAEIDNTLYTGKIIQSSIGPVETSSLEMLNQHLTRHLDPERVRAYEVDRGEFFMPTKQVSGVDSVVSTTRMMSDRFAERLRSVGALIHETAICDLGPSCGDSDLDLRQNGIGPDWSLDEGARLFACLCRADPDDSPPCDAGLKLEKDACLMMRSKRPYGDLRLGPSRSLLRDRERASRLRIGKNVTIRPGISVDLAVAPGASLRVRDGADFHHDVHIEVPEGESLQIP